MSEPIDALFYVGYPYYFPHYLPISRELERQGKRIKYVLSEKQNAELMSQIAADEGVDFVVGEHHLSELTASVIFFANVYHGASELKAATIFLCHGTGTKQCKFESALRIHDVVLVEGEYRYQKYCKKYPELSHKLRKVGYSKLDPIVNISQQEQASLSRHYGLDTGKKTILYAPTFFPSSIEKMGSRFPADFEDCNIIVKPHYLSLERSSYKSQRRIFDDWAEHPNCQIMGAGEYNLVPFLAICDVMISDESSAIFEFASLNKPVIINRFLKLRFSYYLNPKKLLQRMDSGINRYREIGENPRHYPDMVKAVRIELENPRLYEKKRLELAADICGEIDGEVSLRIAEIVRELSD